MKLLIAIILFTALSTPLFSLANGGDQRLVDGTKYYINLSRAPFTPRVGVKTSILASIPAMVMNFFIYSSLIY